jgi:hypothetical protein
LDVNNHPTKGIIMKTIIFTFAVVAAAGYLAYSQLPEVHQMIDNSIGEDQQYSENLASLKENIARLEAEVLRLKNQPVSSLGYEIDDFVANIDDIPLATTMNIKERSNALLELAERMELKAIGQ